MKKSFCFAFLICISTLLFSQDVFIGGVNKNRLLTWNDFSGKPDENSPHDANTYWNINYGFKGISFKGDTAKITGFSATLTLNENLSWIKSEKQTNYLLKHEQGHFDIGLICQREILNQFNNTVFLKSDFQSRIPAIFSALLEKYRLLGLKYDEETDHSKNQAAQDKWNSFFPEALNK
jgi:hypothetical protein